MNLAPAPVSTASIAVVTSNLREKFTVDVANKRIEGSFMSPGVMRAFGVSLDGPTYAEHGAKLLGALEQLASAHLEDGSKSTFVNLETDGTLESASMRLTNAEGGKAIISLDDKVTSGPARDAIVAAEAIMRAWDTNGGLKA